MADSQPATEREPAPATYTPAVPRELMPREMRVERVGNIASGITREFPEVRGGVCDYCGVIDSNYPSEYQYKLCGHYRGLNLVCSYCPTTKNHEEVVGHARLRILEHPDKPGTLIVHCDSFNCLDMHRKKWNTAAS